MNHLEMGEYLQGNDCPPLNYKIYRVMHPLGGELIITNADMGEMRKILNKYTGMLDDVNRDYRDIHLQEMLIKEGFECFYSHYLPFYINGISKIYGFYKSRWNLTFDNPLKQRLKQFYYKIRTLKINLKWKIKRFPW